MTTSQRLTPHDFQKQISGVREALVKMCLSQESEPVYTVSEVDSFLHVLISSRAKKKKINPNGFSLKMLRDFYQVAGDEIISTISLSWTKQGMTSNGKCSTVPQNRERIYTLGHLRSRGERQVLPISGESGSHLKQLVGGMQSYRVYDPRGIATTLVGEGGRLGAKTGLYLIDQSLTEPKLTDEARCITARYTAGVTKRTAMNSGVLEVQPILIPDRVNKRQNGRRLKEQDEPMFTLTSQDRHGVIEGIKVRNGTKQGYQMAEVGDSVDLSYPNSPTRRARVGKGIAHNLSCGGQMGAVVWNGRVVKIRRLTPRECFRLQGFSDDLFEKAQAVNSDASSISKQAMA